MSEERPTVGVSGPSSASFLDYVNPTSSLFLGGGSSSSSSAPPAPAHQQDALSKVSAQLECPICLCCPLVEPITLPCGHTFDRHCLHLSLSKNAKRCPSCRAVCHINAENASENVALREICSILYPEAYAARSRELHEQKQAWSNTLPVFFYGVASFPGYKLSLHLFEERYKILAARSVESTRTFAYCPTSMPRIGALVLVAQIDDAMFYPDGRCLLEARLTTRHTIVEYHVEDDTGLCVAKISPAIRDESILDAVEAEAAEQLVREAMARWTRQNDAWKRVFEAKFGAPPALPAATTPTPSPSAEGEGDGRGGANADTQSSPTAPGAHAHLKSLALEACSLWIASISSSSSEHSAIETALDLLSTRDTLRRIRKSAPRFMAVIELNERFEREDRRSLLLPLVRMMPRPVASWYFKHSREFWIFVYTCCFTRVGTWYLFHAEEYSLGSRAVYSALSAASERVSHQADLAWQLLATQLPWLHPSPNPLSTGVTLLLHILLGIAGLSIMNLFVKVVPWLRSRALQLANANWRVFESAVNVEGTPEGTS